MKSPIARTTLVLASSALLATMIYAAQTGSSGDATHDQESAVGSIRSINTAESYYAKEYGKGYSPTLAALGEAADGVKPSADAASLLSHDLTNGTKANYVFTYTAGKPDTSAKIGTYTLSVRPLKWRPGMWNYFDDDSAIIRGTKKNRAATVSDPPLQ